MLSSHLPWRNSRGWRFRNDSDDLELIEVGLLERHDYLNLNRGTAGQLGNTNTGARMGAAFLAKQFKDKFRRTIGYRALLIEVGCAVNEDRQFEHTIDAVERAQRLAQRRQCTNEREASPSLAFLQRYIPPDLAHDMNTIPIPRQLPADIGYEFVDNDRRICRSCRRGCWQFDAKFLQAILDAHLLSRRLGRSR